MCTQQSMALSNCERKTSVEVATLHWPQGLTRAMGSNFYSSPHTTLQGMHRSNQSVTVQRCNTVNATEIIIMLLFDAKEGVDRSKSNEWMRELEFKTGAKEGRLQLPHWHRGLIGGVEWLMDGMDGRVLDSSTRVSQVTKGEMSAKTTYQRSAKGPVSISDCSADGKFIAIENTGRKVYTKAALLRSIISDRLRLWVLANVPVAFLCYWDIHHMSLIAVCYSEEKSSRDNYSCIFSFWKIPRKTRSTFWQNWTEK